MDTSPAVNLDVETPQAESCLDYVIFELAGEPVSWGRVLATAEFLGLLNPLLEDLSRIALIGSMPDDERPPIQPEDMQETLTQLRYHHNLITAEETAAWLASRHLDLDDLQTFLTQSLWCDQLAHANSMALPPLSNSTEEIARQLWVHVTLRDLWQQFLPAVIRRQLVASLDLQHPAADRQAQERAEGDFLRSHGQRGDNLQECIAKCHFVASSFGELVQQEASYQQYASDVANSDSIRKRLPALRPQLFTVNYELAHFSLLEVVREAYLCVTVDGEPLEAVAKRAQGEFACPDCFIEDLTADLQQLMISAKAGEFLPPVEADTGGYYLVKVLSKVEPVLEDSNVLQRVQRSLIEEAFTPYLEQEITWPTWQLIPQA